MEKSYCVWISIFRLSKAQTNTLANTASIQQIFI